MDETGTERGNGGAGEASAATAALERIVDPVVAVADGTITYLNAAAAEAFDAPAEASGRSPADVLGTTWERLEPIVDETAVGAARTVSLADDRFDARLHRGVDGATITFVPDGPARDDDEILKGRAVAETPVGVAISDPAREDNPLIYVNDAFERTTGYPFDEVVGRNCRFLQGEASDPETVDEMREAIDDDRPVTVELVNYRKDGTPFWNEVTLAPMYDDDGEVTNYVGFQNDVTARKEAELEVERHRDELESVLERVEGLIQDVTTAIAGAASRSELEVAVCDRFVDEPTVEGVWIGERSPATGALEPRASAGDVPESPAEADDHPAVVALEDGELTVGAVGDTAVAAVPLSYSGVEYGVLVVRTTDEDDVDDRGEVILSALARAIASGINARESSRMLATDAVVAVDLELVDHDVAPVALSAAADCTLEYRRSVHRTGGTASLYSATGATMDDLVAAAADLEDLDLVPIVDRGDSSLVELSGDDNVVEWLSDRGAVARTIRAEDGRARLTLEVPRSANVRAVIEAVEERYPETDVVSFRQRERDGETRQEFAARLEAELTERQLAALQRAYLGGYFEWPRPTTGEELAQSMGVSRPTFHEHLRTAEAKLCGAFFDGEHGDE
ncbi:bacterio-opsin activator domain-containing protein [Natronobeatus ordinarius]|uniref:bacterio-opsin activator domain-containing protein n=1 Tax=Natronobeatus ordinarius TaxID=2963433 RepID=UPI0020CB7278|nr:bacterio-opsin activator domain-containing protein [Natronobeatus ordinarius]